MMKEISYNEFRSNDFCSLILNVYYDELQNKGFRQFEENLKDEDFLKVFSLIFNQFYLLQNNKIRVIDFKKEFEKFKELSVSGSVNIELKDSDVKKFICYKGEFVLYSTLSYWLFLRVFEDEINNEETVYARIKDIFYKNYRELEYSPINCVVFQPFSNFFSNCGYSSADISEYVKDILELIKQDDEENELNEEDDLILDVEELSTIGKKVILMKELGVLDFLIEKYQEEKNINQLANIIHCFTGLGSRSIQSILNPIYNTENDQKNNPYSNKKNIAQVKAKLAELQIQI